MPFAKALAVLVVFGLIAGSGFLYSGTYDAGADEPHWPLTFGLIETLRDRSVATRARAIAVPPGLDSADRARRGAGNYDAMCTGCHLKPGMDDSEIRKGLYPQPPNLADAAAQSPASQFWVIKHGIKMTAMPAWSKAGVDDDTIWDMVALLQRLPGLTPGEYQALVETSGGHTHASAGRGDGHSHEEAPSGHVPVAAADAFSAAIATGDEAAVKALLDPDVLIYESGGQESSRDEYAAHHLKEDMAFLAGAQVQVLDRKHGVDGDLAWVATRTRITGSYKDKPMDLYSTESLMLKRAPAGWRIVHVQWSSQPAASRTK